MLNAACAWPSVSQSSQNFADLSRVSIPSYQVVKGEPGGTEQAAFLFYVYNLF